MHDLYTISRECLAEVRAAGITPGRIYAFELNYNLSRVWGRCCYDWGMDASTIELQPFLLKDETPLEVLKNTLIHEILHTCEGCHNHGKLWKSYADKMNALYGYHISRLANQEEITACMEAGTYKPKPRRAQEPTRYIIECMGCGQTIKRSRESDFVRFPSMYRCGICGGDHWKRTNL